MGVRSGSAERAWRAASARGVTGAATVAVLAFALGGGAASALLATPTVAAASVPSAADVTTARVATAPLRVWGEPLPVVPESDESETPTPTPTPEPTETAGPPPTPEPDPTEEPTGEPTEAPTVPPETVEPVETPEPTEAPTETPVPTVVPAVPPAAADPTTSVVSWVIAAFVLVVAAGILLLVRRRGADAETAGGPDGGDVIGAGVAASVVPSSSAGAEHDVDAPATLAAMEDIGAAMTDAGYSVTTVRQTLIEVAEVNGLAETEIVVFPTALLVSARGVGAMSTGAVASGERSLLLHQVDDLQHIVDDARSGSVAPEETRERVRRMRELPRPYSPVQRGAAYVLLSAGLAVLLGASWTGVVFAGVLGAGVGTVLLVGERLSGRYRALLTVAIAFSVAIIVLLGLRLGLDSGVLPALIAPLVVLLPGALLTVGSIELATGQMLSGAGRLAAGAMQLVLLGVGIVAAGALIGIPALAATGSASTLGVIAPWIAVALFGVGIVVYQCGPRRSLGWILVVLYVAYGAQVLGAVFFGGVLSALIGALVVTPVTAIVARQRSGPAALVSFLPAFWLLVPGALGLVGVATVLGGEATGSSSLITTLATMVSISLGVLAGTALSSRIGRPVL
ncbi:threonine/serine exporter ThrE family protein [Agromyces sp. Leaf222]|uniref:threonine/serine ThrE exporter family protein n=1 Tax=Agromyces sp. Leaf222 TaxID=1735688 RepID=UPI0012FB48EA|nr:threonine/serine exporter family protein [Agromyces sp. Leaf222]